MLHEQQKVLRVWKCVLNPFRADIVRMEVAAGHTSRFDGVSSVALLEELTQNTTCVLSDISDRSFRPCICNCNIHCCRFSKGEAECHFVGMTKAVLANAVNAKYTVTMKTLSVVHSNVWPFRNLDVV